MHRWAKDLPEQIVGSATWDDSWECYAYALVGADDIRIKESELEPIDGTLEVAL